MCLDHNKKIEKLEKTLKKYQEFELFYKKEAERFSVRSAILKLENSKLKKENNILKSQIIELLKDA